jgi:spermidine synthase
MLNRHMAGTRLRTIWLVVVALLPLLALAAAERYRLRLLGSTTEAFEGQPDAATEDDGGPKPATRVELKTLHSEHSKLHHIEVVQTGDARLGKCLRLDGVMQACERDEHRYHEMLVHFPVQYLPGGTPKRVLIVGGGDLMALREVMKYDAVQSVVLLEPDAALVSVCERHLGVSRFEHDVRVHITAGTDPAQAVRKLLEQAENIESYDLAIVDLKERAMPSAASQGSRELYSSLRTLLRENGVLVKNGDADRDVLAQVFSHTLVYSFHSVTHDAQYRMVAASRGVDLGAKRVDAARMKGTHRVHARFYEPLKHYGYVPWFALGGKPPKAPLLGGIRGGAPA